MFFFKGYHNNTVVYVVFGLVYDAPLIRLCIWTTKCFANEKRCSHVWEIK